MNLPKNCQSCSHGSKDSFYWTLWACNLLHKNYRPEYVCEQWEVKV